MEKIGVFGGTFDPVHNEHIIVAEMAVKDLGLDRLIIMPTFISPHKKNKLTASANDRLQMCRLAFGHIKEAEVSSYEIERQGSSYTYITAEHLAKNYKGSELYFIVGGDMFNDFMSWKNPELIVKYMKIAVVRRGRRAVNIRKMNDFFHQKFGCRAIILRHTGGKISSTKVRRLCSLQKNLSEFVPQNVEDYIFKNKLYRDKFVDYVKSLQSKKRFEHSVRVAEFALLNAAKFAVNADIAFYTGLLHDLAKGNEDSFSHLYHFGEEVPEKVRHQYIGAEMAAEILGIADDDILNSIRYHTSGRENMSALEKLIFVSDMLEEGRDFWGVKSLRGLLKKDAELCFRMCLKKQYETLNKQNKEIYNLTKKAYNYYFKETGDING